MEISKKKTVKAVLSILVLALLVCAVCAKDRAFTASTPAAPVVRSFLGISLKDSIDFIRWHLAFTDTHFTLQCHYGISKPNTNDFLNGGQNVELDGNYEKKGIYYRLQHGTTVLSLAEWNNNLLHILDEEDNLLVGNGAWSFTLNHLSPTSTDQLNLTTRATLIKDSLNFEGRTPCGIPGIMATGQVCYKLKWHIILYAKGEMNGLGSYKIMGTPWRNEGGRKGTWKMLRGKNDRIMYQLNDEKGNGLLHFVKIDENILAFTDADGNLLVGDSDFSYTLNTRRK